ncbi:hypothetical protein GE061_003743 [Apolygus lucorum]|uniref:C2H2-type domain-containing protein n=1 Tax=Apolygus lucorum TaxID=248454 RepID=A0A8S9X6X8_APOLU|nr:hypothetical protein GE061_003743 [Apolygus lucorum]
MLSSQKTCQICSKSVSSEKSLRRHYLTAHPESLDSRKPSICRNSSIDCPLCGHSPKKLPELLKHFSDVHDFSMREEAHDFVCTADFLKWKQEVERVTKSLFVKVRGTTHLKCVRGKKDIFVCHRSGKCRGKISNRIRHQKSQGSQKLNAFCPARMKVVVTEGDRVFLNFLPTHVGHDCDAAHLRLSQSEREMLAKKMDSKRPMDDILQEIKNSPEPLGRLKLLTKQDLYNVSRDPGVLTSVYSGGEISEWANDPERNSSVLIFKPHGSALEGVPELENDDFILCLLNEKQKTLFCESDCVSFDSFEASSPSEYNLFYVACIIGETASPCALLITNRQDSTVLELFLRTVISSTGVISPRVVFHERESLLFNAWKRSFNHPSEELFGSWQVEHEWRKVSSQLVKTPHKKLQIC